MGRVLEIIIAVHGEKATNMLGGTLARPPARVPVGGGARPPVYPVGDGASPPRVRERGTRVPVGGLGRSARVPEGVGNGQGGRPLMAKGVVCQL